MLARSAQADIVTRPDVGGYITSVRVGHGPATVGVTAYDAERGCNGDTPAVPGRGRWRGAVDLAGSLRRTAQPSPDRVIRPRLAGWELLPQIPATGSPSVERAEIDVESERRRTGVEVAPEIACDPGRP
jgi:hypothetical protein